MMLAQKKVSPAGTVDYREEQTSLPQLAACLLEGDGKTEVDMKATSGNADFKNISLNQDETAIVIIDQTRLPNERLFLTLSNKEACFDAILKLQVRGAPAIGIFAGYAMYVLSKQWEFLPYPDFLKKVQGLGAYLVSSRPTAVNLSWAVRRLTSVAEDAGKTSDKTEPDVGQILSRMGNEAKAIHKEDIEMCFQISQHGLSILKDGEGILTHCNAGPLATSRYGTALGPILLGKEKGMNFRVYADETRPLLQGARLTAYELQEAGVDVTLICDNMASIVMKNGWVDKVFVGCDRIAANGDFANKIGTSGVAILANFYKIPVYVLGPSSTIDLETPSGDDIVIEQRDPDEIRTKWYQKPMASENVKCYNPSFDVTNHSLVSGIITEKGIVRPPFEENLRKLFGRADQKG